MERDRAQCLVGHDPARALRAVRRQRRLPRPPRLPDHNLARTGRHTFTALAKGEDGQTARDTVIARVVPAPVPPGALAGRWKRIVTAADLTKSGKEAPPPATGHSPSTASASGPRPTRLRHREPVRRCGQYAQRLRPDPDGATRFGRWWCQPLRTSRHWRDRLQLRRPVWLLHLVCFRRRVDVDGQESAMW